METLLFAEQVRFSDAILDLQARKFSHKYFVKTSSLEYRTSDQMQILISSTPLSINMKISLLHHFYFLAWYEAETCK